MTTDSLKEIMESIRFPHDIISAMECIIDDSTYSIVCKIKNASLLVNEINANIDSVDKQVEGISKIAEKRKVIHALFNSTHSTSSSKLSENKKKLEISEIITKRNKFIQEFHEKTVNAERFVKKINKRTEEVENNIKKQREKQANKEKMELEACRSMEEDKIKLTEQRKIENKLKLEAFNQEMNNRKERRYQLLRQKVPKANEYTYKKNMHNDEILKKQEFQKYSQAHQTIKLLYKPIRINQIKEHEKHYITTKKLKESARENSVLGIKKKSIQNQKMLEKLATAGYRKFSVELKSLRNSYFRDKEDKSAKLNKMKKVAQIMQSLHKPLESQRKKNELMQQIEKIATKPRTTRHDLTASDITIGSCSIDELSSTQKIKRYPWRSNISKHPKIKADNTLPDISTKPVYKNYLPHLNNKRSLDPNKIIHSIIDDDRINKKEKFDMVKAQVEIMEQKALMTEKLALLAKSNHKTLEDSSDMFINAIKAKLTLLDSI